MRARKRRRAVGFKKLEATPQRGEKIGTLAGEVLASRTDGAHGIALDFQGAPRLQLFLFTDGEGRRPRTTQQHLTDRGPCLSGHLAARGWSRHGGERVPARRAGPPACAQFCSDAFRYIEINRLPDGCLCLLQPQKSKVLDFGIRKEEEAEEEAAKLAACLCFFLLRQAAPEPKQHKVSVPEGRACVAVRCLLTAESSAIAVQ